MCHLSYVCFTACKLKFSLVKTMQWNNTLHDLVLVLVKCELNVSFLLLGRSKKNMSECFCVSQ